MQFVYDENSSNSSLTIKDETYKYLFKARRHKINDEIAFRNLNDEFIYFYKVSNISKKEAIVNLISKKSLEIQSNKKLHIIWCIVDTKTIEKQLPYLNELGVDKISFVHCDYSQKIFKPNFEKFNKILINSSQQCGRSSIIKLDIIESLDKFLEEFPDTHILHFSQNYIEQDCDIKRVIIGCEGGFSKQEIGKFKEERIIGLKSKLILRSETAITAIASKILV